MGARCCGGDRAASSTALIELADLTIERPVGAQIAETIFPPSLADELARRCSESEAGARNIDHVLRGGLMPLLSQVILSRLAEEKPVRSVQVGLADGGFQVEVA